MGERAERGRCERGEGKALLAVFSWRLAVGSCLGSAWPDVEMPAAMLAGRDAAPTAISAVEAAITFDISSSSGRMRKVSIRKRVLVVCDEV